MSTAIETATPVFSIIVPTHNRAALLCRAIASVIDQTYGDFELIVVDDGSTDGTPQTVGSFADKRVHYLRLDCAGGASAARNAGIRAARGRYISFLDDDDELLPLFLEEMYDAMDSSSDEVGFAWSGIQRVRQAGAGIEVIRRQTWRNLYLSNGARRVGGPEYLLVGTGFGLTVKSELFEAVGTFDETLAAAVDTDLMFRLGAVSDYLVLPGVHVTVYNHPGDQLTDRNERRATAMERVIANNLREIGKSDMLWIRYHRNVAELFYAIGNRRRGRYWMMRAIARQPYRWRTWKSWLLFELFGTENLGLRNVLRMCDKNCDAR